MKKLENKYLRIANECAEASGKIIKKYFRKKIKIERKSDNSPVTKADKEAEKVIRDIIIKKALIGKAAHPPSHQLYSSGLCPPLLEIGSLTRGGHKPGGPKIARKPWVGGHGSESGVSPWV